MNSTHRIVVKVATLLWITMLLVACGGGGGGNGGGPGGGGGDTVGSDATLSGLSLSTGSLTPGFASEQTSYSVEVDFDVMSVQITATAADSAASLTINDVSVSSGEASEPIELQQGLNAIPVQVTAEDGSSTETYSVEITRRVVAAMLDAEARIGAVTLDWADTGAPRYNLIYATAPDCDVDNFSLCPGGNMALDVTAPHTETGLSNGQNYWFYLESAATGTTALSNEVGARPDSLAPNGLVEAIAVDAAEGITYLGGQFTRIGLRSGHGALLSAESGQFRAFPLVNGDISAAVADGHGGFYIGGDFTEVSGEPRNGSAQIRANGTLTDWAPAADDSVLAFAVADGIVYAGGAFVSIDSDMRPFFAPLEAPPAP